MNNRPKRKIEDLIAEQQYDDDDLVVGVQRKPKRKAKNDDPDAPADIRGIAAVWFSVLGSIAAVAVAVLVFFFMDPTGGAPVTFPEFESLATSSVPQIIEMRPRPFSQNRTNLGAMSVTPTPARVVEGVRAFAPTSYITMVLAEVRECPEADNKACPIIAKVMPQRTLIANGFTDGDIVAGSSTWVRVDYAGRAAYVHSKSVREATED